MTPKRRLLVVSHAAGLLARAARSGGYEPIVIDAFGDRDTIAAGLAYRELPVIGGAIDGSALCRLIKELSVEFGRNPIVWASGFEGAGHILSAIAARHPLVGSSPRALLALAQPSWPSRATTDSNDLTLFTAPAYLKPDDIVALIKPRAAAGGMQIRYAKDERFLASAAYYQAYYHGRSVSCLGVSGRDGVEIVGWSEHFAIQASAEFPFRQSAAVAMLRSHPQTEQVQTILAKIAAKFGVFGLFGCDFIELENGELRLVDLNPRITASAPLHIPLEEIISCHLNGKPPRSRTAKVCATAVLYADSPISVSKGLDWPTWVSDIPNTDRIYKGGEPLVSIGGEGDDADEAKSILRRRKDKLIANLMSPPVKISNINHS